MRSTNSINKKSPYSPKILTGIVEYNEGLELLEHIKSFKNPPTNKCISELQNGIKHAPKMINDIYLYFKKLDK